jgi:hypothetical protein
MYTFALDIRICDTNKYIQIEYNLNIIPTEYWLKKCKMCKKNFSYGNTLLNFKNKLKIISQLF